MQHYTSDGTRQERTGWRDESISQRHRQWGFNCPAVDLDFLVVEYNLGKPVALIEYKHFKARQPRYDHPTYRALSMLADGYNDPLPFLVVFYWPDVWAFKCFPVNGVARKHFGEKEMLCERDFVKRLYRMRRLVLADHLEGTLSVRLPEGYVA